MVKTDGLTPTTRGQLCEHYAKKIAGFISFGIEKSDDEKQGK
jgi:hypothetical protein